MDASSPRTQIRPITIGAAIALLGALAVHVMAPILVWQWTRQPFIGVLLEHTLVVGAVKETWAGAAAGLRNPDRIVEINGTAVHTYRELVTAVEAFAPGDSVTLTVETSAQTTGWTTREVAVALDVFSLADLIVRFVVPYSVGFCYLAIGAWILYRRGDDDKASVFAILCASASIAITVTFDVSTTHVLTRVWTFVLSTAGVALIYLGLSFLPRENFWRRSLWARLLPLVPAGAIGIWAQIALYGHDPRSYFLPWLASYILMAASVLAFATILAYVRSRPSLLRVRLQTQVILLGTVAAFTPTGIWIVASATGRLFPTIGQFYPFEPLINIPVLIAFPLSIGYAIYRYQLLDTDLLFSPLHHSRNTYRTTIRDFTHELAASQDIEYIVGKLLSYVDSLLQPKHALVFMISQSDIYEPYQTQGDIDARALQAIRFTLHDRLVAKLQRDGESLLLTPVAIENLRLDADERTRLESLDAVLVVPLRAKEHLLGILAMGAIKSNDMYAADDITLLETMADQAAVAAENALLHAQQVTQEYRLVQQTRRLTDILAVGNQLKSLDRDIVAQSTVKAVHDRLGFDLVTLSLVEEDDPTRVRVVAWAGIESATWERLVATPIPLIDFETREGVERLGHCYLVFAGDTIPRTLVSPDRVPWREGDQLYVPLTAGEELLGYVTVEQPRDGLRPSDNSLEVLEILANQAAIAVQNANLYSSIDRALDERVAELATLQEIDNQLNVKLDFDYVMNMTLAWAMRTTSAVAGTLALVSPDRRALNVVAHKGYPPEMDAYWDAPWPMDEGIMGRVIQTGEPEMIEDVAKFAEYVNVEINPRSHIAAPIKHEGRVVGTIALESAEPNGFTIDHMSFLMRLADHAAIAIENVRLYEQTNRLVDYLTALQQISLDLTSSLNLNAVLESVAANALTLAQADEITIYLYDEHEDTLSFETGLSRQGKQDHPSIPIAESELTTTVAHRAEPVVIHDTHEAVEYPSLLVKWQIGAIASIPLQKGGHVLGVFDVVFGQAHYFAQDELRALNLLADQAAIAVQNAQLFREVQRANEAKSEFVSIVSHELKVPMTSIQGYARLITLGAAGPVSQQQAEFADIILRNVERMGNLVRDLLDLARIESGRIKISPRPTDLSKIVQDAVRSIRTEIEARKNVLEVAMAEDLPSVKADPELIMQVWINLLSNAYKYTPHGGQIRAWARQHGGRGAEATDGRWVLCAVEDNGIGIGAEDQARIFEQFYRVQHPDQSEEKGTGLGLSITRSIVELHGGRIWLESEPGQGSTFYFTLPAA